MINFLPPPYPDELFISLIGRYRQKSGIFSNTALESDLFNKKRVSGKSILFPLHLGAFINNLPPTTKLSVEEIIFKHTMYPFYTAFLSQEKSQIIFNGMEEGSSLNIENMVGISGSKVKPQDFLRYCPLCFQQDIEILGESYWRRLHQIPGVLYCSDHKILLKQSKLLANDCRTDYVTAIEAYCNIEVMEDTYPLEIKELNLEYIDNVSYLLFRNQKRKELSFINDYYVDRLREHGLASESGNIYMQRLLEGFVKYYPTDYLELMQSNFEVKKEANWVRLFIHYTTKNRSPLRHLLFLQFLGLHVKDLFHTIRVEGKKTKVQYKHTPSFSLQEQREAWLQIIRENPNANRTQLKQIGKGLHSWIRKHDLEWYEKVTPRNNIRKKRKEIIDWKKRDQECLVLAKKAVKNILSSTDKPTRIVPNNIRREVGAKRWFNHPKLVKTQQYMSEVTEDIDSFRKRKIRWAINEMVKNNEKLTVYKIELKAGFGGSNKKEIKELIEGILKNIN